MKSHSGKVRLALCFFVGLFTAAAALAIGLGPLDPPAGPVEQTDPSLADLQNQVQQLEVTLGQTSGPWEIFSTTGGSNVTTAVNIVTGPAILHSVSVSFGWAIVFDGPGTIDAVSRNPTSGEYIATAVSTVSAGNGPVRTDVLPLDVEVSNGISVAWTVSGNSTAGPRITVLYRPLQ